MRFVFQVKFSEERGISSSASARLILFMGIFVAVGRLAGGFLCSLKKSDNFYILQSVLLVNGVSTVLLKLAHKYEALVAYAIVFGFCDGMMATAFNVIGLTCVDHSKAASSFGFLLFVVSATSLAGPPISGGLTISFLDRTKKDPELVLVNLFCIVSDGKKIIS